MNGGSCSNNVVVALPFHNNSEEAIENEESLVPKVLNKKFLCKCPPEFEGIQCEVGIKLKLKFITLSLLFRS